MKTILKICSSFLLAFVLLLSFPGVASANYTPCDLTGNDYTCPNTNLDLYDVIAVELPGDTTVVVEVAPFEGGSYTLNYDLGTTRKVETYEGIEHLDERTPPYEELGFLQNIPDPNTGEGQTINITISKKY
ncbi:MAG: hypothetical protein F6K21_31330 [Symploca sp. SIO2D2]|nr:hypothetical protein [Symploca sp. SIO2D2]